MMFHSWFGSKEVREVKKAIKLMRKKLNIDVQLAEIRPEIKRYLQNKDNRKISIANLGTAAIKINSTVILNSSKLTELLKRNPELLVKYVTQLSTPKLGVLEKELGPTSYAKLIDHVTTTESVVLNVYDPEQNSN